MAKRRDVTFVSQGEHCAAWLYLPEGKPAPVIVMAHGLGGVRGMRLDAFAERFCEQGYACLVFDYRHFGDSDGEPRQLLDIKKQEQDWAAAVAYVRSLASVDNKRVVLWGSSFSGGHVIWTASFDHGIAAVIAQCPFTDGPSSAWAMNPLISTAATAKAIADKTGALMRRKPVMIATAGEPGTLALMATSDSMQYLDLVPEGANFRNEVAARFALDIVRHRPGTRAKKITCPAFFVVCENDTVAPASATLKHVRNAPKGQIKVYKWGHFEIYAGNGFEEVIADEIAFLKVHVPVKP